MPNLPVPGTVHCRIFGQYYGQQIINHIDFTKDDHSAPDLIETTDIAILVDGWWGNSVLPLLVNDYFYIRTVARSLHTAIDWQVKIATNAGAGGLVGDGEPGNVALRMNYDAGVGGRSAHWGTQISGIAKVNQSGNAAAIDWASSVTDAFNAIFDPGLIPVGWHWTVITRVAAGVPLNPPQTINVQSATLNDYNLDSQKTRLTGHGR